MSTNVNIKAQFTTVVLGIVVLLAIMTSSKDPSERERQALAKFRPIVKDILTHEYQKTDGHLLSWLRANNLNVNEAVSALREAQKWRKDNRIDSLINETVLEFSSPPYSLDGVDKQGRPVLALSTSKVDLRKFILGGKREKVLRYFIQSTERALAKALEGTNGTTTKDPKFISIIDLQGFSLRQHGCLPCIELYVEFTRINEKYYPGVLAHDLWINTPRIALPIVEVLRPLISEESQKIFKVFGTNKDEWSKFLLKIIPADQLAFQFGGTKPNN